MTPGLEVKVCTNCAKSRRKCGKQRPLCLRCRTRGLSCHYPRVRPTSFVPLREDTSDANKTANEITITPSPLELCFPFVDDSLASWWFASPSTWAIDSASCSPTTNTSDFSASSLDRALRKVLGWLGEWVETGTCPFMHQQLYLDCFPASIEGAYLTLSAYLRRTPLNAPVVERIIESRATGLVAAGLNSDSGPFSTLENLVQVQALLVYQCIGLSSGSIRLRRLAECHIPVMEAWIMSLMQQASYMFTSSIDSFFASPDLRSIPRHNHLWYTWIVVESVRRIWLVVAIIQGMYKVLAITPTSLIASPFMGGTLFTSRKGFWEAGTAGAWEKECSERNAGMVRLTETEKLFEMVPREEICEFAKLVLECTYGVEWCEMRGV
ncbi:hypothetical protein CC86DRAFT_141431 [Ophiobolus disseminans]|uniref:Zn(2)-C6 fungal-type domain-containing protein n=1 Tax=Ophiobolus disseminans TaxID=1469910 RepID=A0A6A7AFF2_9PLEO|nr:hypothetical protein CC86DRAFT_141431 [Ophiobolus disseminans]